MASAAHTQKINRWRDYARERGLRRSLYYPPVERLMEVFGLEFTPIMFWSFFMTALLFGSYFGIFWGVAMYLSVWREMPLSGVCGASLAAGGFFGLFMAWYFSWSKRKLSLPPWDSF